MKKLIKSYNIFIILAVAVVLLTVVCVPVYGLGDMSEYLSVFQNTGLYNVSEDTFCIAQSYGIDANAPGAQNLFEMFLGSIVNLNKMLFSNTVFNIHFLSSVYCIVFLLGMYFLQKNTKLEKPSLNYLFSALLSVIFLDLGYLAYFNSFYSEALTFVLVILIAALAVSVIHKFSYLKIVFLSLALIVFSGLKVTGALTSLLFGALLVLYFKEAEGKKKIVSVTLATLVIITSAVSVFSVQIPARDVKLYSHVYNDIVQNNKGDFSNLNLKEVDDNPTIEDMEEAVADITYGDLVRYYAKNPSVFINSLKLAANNSYFLILDFASYREAGAYYGIRDMLNLKIWNKLKRTVIPSGLPVILIFMFAYVCVSVKEYLKYSKIKDRNRSGVALFCTVLPVAALCEMIGTVLTTGQILISKNMFVFGIYFDLMIVTAIVWGVSTLVSRRDSIREKYGVNQ